MNTPRLHWDIGTAYDLFLSLHVIYNPDKYGLRGAWAAGVRSRLPNAEREFLQEAAMILWPLDWIYNLPQPKSGAIALEALANVPVKQRLQTLCHLPQSYNPELHAFLDEIMGQGSWGKKDMQRVKSLTTQGKASRFSKKELTTLLNIWARPGEFGEMILAALTIYYEAFFAEEEARILPALEASTAKGQKLAGELPFLALLEALSQGLLFEEMPNIKEMVLVPSFWITPLVMDYPLSPDKALFVFGGRPGNASLVPGELVPHDLHQALKALADPTRLRILHYLSEEPLTPSKLAKLLRLRAPTVVHHLHVLRLARLVHLTVGTEGKRRYTIRPGATQATFSNLETFLNTTRREGK